MVRPRISCLITSRGSLSNVVTPASRWSCAQVAPASEGMSRMREASGDVMCAEAARVWK